MNCTWVQENLVQYVLGELDDVDNQWLSQHLSDGCVQCQSLLWDLQHGIAAVYEALPAENIGTAAISELQAEVLARAAATDSWHEPEPVTVNRLAVHTVSRSRNVLYAASFLAGLLLVVGLTPRAAEEQGGLPAMSSVHAVTRQNMKSARPAAEQVAKSVIFFASLSGEHTNTRVITQSLYDSDSDEIHFFCQNLSTAPNAGEYVLATVLPDGQIEILAQLRADSSGRCKAVLSNVSAYQAKEVSKALRSFSAIGNPRE